MEGGGRGSQDGAPCVANIGGGGGGGGKEDVRPGVSIGGYGGAGKGTF